MWGAGNHSIHAPPKIAILMRPDNMQGRNLEKIGEFADEF